MWQSIVLQSSLWGRRRLLRSPPMAWRLDEWGTWGPEVNPYATITGLDLAKDGAIPGLHGARAVFEPTCRAEISAEFVPVSRAIITRFEAS